MCAVGLLPWARVTPCELVIPQLLPRGRDGKSPQPQPCFGSFGMSPTALMPGASALLGGPCRSPVPQLPLALSVPVLLLPLCILQAHSDVC